MNVYLFVIVPFMAIMCGVFAWIISSDIRAIWRSITGGSTRHETIKNASRSMRQAA